MKENANLDFVILEEDMITLSKVKERHNLWWRRVSKVIRNIRSFGKSKNKVSFENERTPYLILHNDM